jgi:hypothetical protein
MKKKSFIDSVKVESPCSQEWEEMIGNDEVRFCSHCSKDVNDLSTMTRKKVERLVRRSKGGLCIRYIKDPKTNGPLFAEQLVHISRRTPRMAAGVMTASLSLASLAYAQGGAVVRSEPAVSRVSDRSCEDVVDKENAAEDMTETSGAGSVSGTVTDQNGAVIPGANVTLSDEKQNEIATASTNDDGVYYFDSLKDGVYGLNVTSNYFKRTVVEEINLVDDTQAVVNVSLEVGEAAVTVGGAMVFKREYEHLISAAVDRGDIDEVRNLIAQGEDVNAEETDNTTPIFVAVESGNLEMVQLLLNFGAKADVRNEEKETPLMKLNEESSRELVELLLQKDAKVNVTARDGSTPLILAAASAKPEVLLALVDAGAEINARNEEGQTALMNAAYDDDLEKVRILLFAGADVNLKNKDDESAWDQTDDDEVENLLVSFGAVVEITIVDALEQVEPEEH